MANDDALGESLRMTSPSMGRISPLVSPVPCGGGMTASEREGTHISFPLLAGRTYTVPLPWREGPYTFPLPWREGIKGRGRDF